MGYITMTPGRFDDHEHSQYLTAVQAGSLYAALAHTHPSGPHDHNDLYYTQAETDTLLGGKSDAGHNHDALYAPVGHEHVHEHPHDHPHDHDGSYSPLGHDHVHDHDAAYAPVGHVHDDRYYTETETDTLLSGKASTAHNHDGSYSPLAHDHDGRYYTETELSTSGSGAAVHWNNLTNTPVTFPPGAHNHDALYAPIGHDHTHDHDAVYGRLAAANQWSAVNKINQDTAGWAVDAQAAPRLGLMKFASQYPMLLAGSGIPLILAHRTDNADVTIASPTIRQDIYIDTAGRVGVGGPASTSAPNTRFEVIGAGSTSSTFAFAIKNSSSNYFFGVRDDGYLFFGPTIANVPACRVLVDTSGYNRGFQIYTAGVLAESANTNGDSLSIYHHSNDRMAIQVADYGSFAKYLLLQPESSSARVGIGGVTSPAYTLDVGGDIGASGNLILANNKAVRLLNNAGTGYAYLTHTTGDNIQLSTSGAGSFQMQVLNATGAIQLLVNSGVYGLIVKNTGDVGVGTGTPQGRLHSWDGAGAFMHRTVTGITGAEAELVPDGTGDVTAGVHLAWSAKPNSGTGESNAGNLITPGSGSATLTVGTITFKLYSTGRLVVYRASGTATWTVSVMAVWT